MTNKSMVHAALLRLLTVATIAALALLIAPSTSRASVSGDTLTENFTDSSGPVKLTIRVTANDRACLTGIKRRCPTACAYVFTHCLDVQDIATSVEYTGSAAASRVKVEYTVQVKFDGKKILATSRGFTLVSNDTICQGPRAGGTTGVKKVTQSGAGSVCSNRWHALYPGKVTYTINWQVTIDNANARYGSKTWEQSLDYDR